MTDRRQSAVPEQQPDFLATLRGAPALLTEGSMYERLRRHAESDFDPALAQASMVFNAPSRRALEQAHNEYLAIGRTHTLPMLALTDTWRANRERIESSRYAHEDVNGECVRMLCALRDQAATPEAPVFVGGMLGPKGDAYTPQQAPDEAEAEVFHSYQVEALAEAEVDFLKASTLPSVAEAIGLARAMSRAASPYFLSFVIRPDGVVLDGTPLDEAFDRIDQAAARPPTGYYVNCVHPTVLLAALETLGPDPLPRLVGFHANTSARSPEELDGLEDIDTEDPHDFAVMMREIHERYGVKILGGCCGTDTGHIRSLAEELQASVKERTASVSSKRFPASDNEGA